MARKALFSCETTQNQHPACMGGFRQRTPRRAPLPRPRPPSPAFPALHLAIPRFPRLQYNDDCIKDAISPLCLWHDGPSVNSRLIAAMIWNSVARSGNGHLLEVRRQNGGHVRGHGGQDVRRPHLPRSDRQEGRKADAPREDGRRRQAVRAHALHRAGQPRRRPPSVRLLPHARGRNGNLPGGESLRAGPDHGRPAARALHRRRGPQARQVRRHRRSRRRTHHLPAAQRGDGALRPWRGERRLRRSRRIPCAAVRPRRRSHARPALQPVRPIRSA